MSQPKKPTNLRGDGRNADEIRPMKIRRRFTQTAPGSVLVTAGNTVVLCCASVVPGVPPWLKETGQGWLTAEYSMLPTSTSPRRPRDRNRVDGRTIEIQRLIGRSLRAVVDLASLGESTIWIDCDVLQADGGTRTVSITGAFVALVDALNSEAPNGLRAKDLLRDSVAAVSAGVVDGVALVDLNYEEDSRAEVDCNFVFTGTGKFVEVQGTGEGTSFSQRHFNRMLKLARHATAQLTDIQRTTLGRDWPFA